MTSHFKHDMRAYIHMTGHTLHMPPHYASWLTVYLLYRAISGSRCWPSAWAITAFDDAAGAAAGKTKKLFVISQLHWRPAPSGAILDDFSMDSI